MVEEEKKESMVEALIPVHSKKSHYDNDESSATDTSTSFLSLLNQVWNSFPQRMAVLSGFSTSYNVVNISMVLPILQSTSTKITNNGWESSLCASLLLGGMIVGQLVGGWLGDVLGRLPALYTVMSFQFIGSLGSAFLTFPYDTDNIDNTILIQLSIWRFMLGIGAGGVYPLQAILSAEDTTTTTTTATTNNNNKNNKEKIMSLVFSIQGVAFLSVPIIALLLLVTLPHHPSLVWRIILAFGAIPSILLFLSIHCSKNKNNMTQIQQIQEEEEEEDIFHDELENHHNHHHPTPSFLHHTLGRELDRNEYFGFDLQPMQQQSLPPEHGNSNKSNNNDNLEKMNINTNHYDDDNNDEAGLLESIRSEPQVIKKLFGTAITWFLFDILFYGNTLFQPIVLHAAFHNDQDDTPASTNHSKMDHATILTIVQHSIFVNLLAMPGYILSFLLMGKQIKMSYCCCSSEKTIKQTPRFIQIQGFICMSILYGSIALLWNQFSQHHQQQQQQHNPSDDTRHWVKKVGLIALYGGTFFFANYGPNTTTFLMPSLVFSSPKCRSTLNGISAAMGKTGALCGAIFFAPMNKHLGSNYVMAFCSITSILAAIITIVCVPPSQQHLPLAQDEE